MAKKRDEAEIEAVRQELPLLPPEEVVETMKKRLTKEALIYRVSFYRDPISGQKIHCCKVTCTACGETSYQHYAVTMPKCDRDHKRIGFVDPCTGGNVYSGSNCKCSNCGADATARHVSDITNDYVEDRKQFVVAYKIRGHLVLLSWAIFKHVTKKSAVEYILRRYEGAATIGGRPIRYTGYVNNMYYSVHWEDGWIARAAWRDNTDEFEADNIFGLREAVTGSDADHCALEEYVRRQPHDVRLGAYLQLWTKYPNVENLVRSGFSGYVNKLIEAVTEYKGYYYSSSRQFYIGSVDNYVDLKKTKPHEIFGLEKEELPLVKKLELEDLRIYRWAKKKKIKLTKQQIGKLRKKNVSVFMELCDGKAPGGFDPPLIKTLNYITERSYDTYYLRDYWSMLCKLYGSVTSELAYPKDLRAAHDKATAALKDKADRELDERIAKRAEALKKLCYEDARLGLMIRPCASHSELIEEGKKLSHCVATYAHRVAGGSTAILFIRRISEPEKPFFTLEWMNGRVIQNRGKNNRDRTPEVEQFEAEWLENLKGVKKHGKHTAKSDESVSAGA